MTNVERFTGQVKFFNREKGFGFITRLSDKHDFFVHHVNVIITSQCRKILFQGEYVEFEVTQGPNGEQADQVTGVQGGTLLCENQFNSQHKIQKNKNYNETNQRVGNEDVSNKK